MAAPEYNFNEPMLSINHRLPSSRRGSIPAVIAKFVQRDVRDLFYNKRRNLSSQTIQDLGFDTASRIYINESLTAQSRAIFAEVKKFRNHHGFKYIWTRNEKVHLKMNDSQPASAVSSVQLYICKNLMTLRADLTVPVITMTKFLFLHPADKLSFYFLFIINYSYTSTLSVVSFFSIR